MNRQETGVLQKLRRSLELLVPLGAILHAVFFVLDNWKYPHEIEVLAGLGILLVALVVLDPASFGRRTARRLAHLFEPDPFIVWFVERDAALPDMQRVWRKKAYLGFLGLSHKSLETYLANELSSGRPLPWESIDIFFANDKFGANYEGAEFVSNVRQSRQLIAAALTDPSNAGQLKKLKHFRFMQASNLGIEYTGSVYGRSGGKPDVFYVVLSSPAPRGETKKALTFRVDCDGTENWNLAHSAVLEHYRLGFGRILKDSHSLGRFQPSVWDQSAADWSTFCEKSALMSREMSGLIGFAGQVTRKAVLDLGCGSGEMSKELLRAGASRLVALDQSPQMLKLAKQRLGNAQKVQYALCTVPTSQRENIDLEGQKFQLIVLHQVLPAIASDKSSLTALAMWCLPYLGSGGKVALAAHDGVVELDDREWADPYRTELRALAIRNPRAAKMLRPPGPKLRPRDIQDAFTGAGFQFIKSDVRAIPITMDERALMWSVPAVLDSFFDIKGVGLDKARALSHEAAELVKRRVTKERVVGYWLFAAP